MPINITSLFSKLGNLRPSADLKAKNLSIALLWGWLFSTYLSFIGGAWLQEVDFFTAAIVIALYQLPPTRLLWLAWLCGLWMDLLSAHHLFGLYALAYLAAASLCMPLRRLFFAEQRLAAIAMSGLFSLALQLMLCSSVLLFGQQGDKAYLSMLYGMINAAFLNGLLAWAYIAAPLLFMTFLSVGSARRSCEP